MSIEKELTIRNKMGMHARPAAQFVKRASKYQCDVWVEKDDEPVNGKSIMGLMMLAAGIGSTVEVICSGRQAADAMAAISTLVEGKFGED